MTTAITTTRLARYTALAALTVACAAGCRNDRGRDDGHGDRVTAHGERFAPEGEARPVQRFARVQSAAAARTDATLHPHHFDSAGDLNSLGRRKLDLMLQDDAGALLVVYLDLARPGVDPAPVGHCRESVRAYLADRGLGAGQLQVRTGPNVGDSHPARDGLRGLKAFNGEESDNASPTGGAAPSRGAGGIEMFARPGQ